ncbi:DUF6193 family natural product biosynthesis protein [Streptomyces sp. M41]|uniref:DUF6193 family natural product biosynthesis protein n=1 Tax=Streptomyces sp. M41 TaxID=3059412 RepID=UPI00374D75F1
MTEHPDPAVPFPDVAARGSLGAAIRAAADEAGLFVAVTDAGSSPLQSTVVDSELPYRNALIVSAYAHERRWSIRGEESLQGLALIEGVTDDLTQLARVAQTWQAGLPLADISRAAPFVRPTGRFEVPDGDPVRLAESEWQHLRLEAGERDRPEYHALIEAAYAEPTLRRLYPFTSHWTLRFSSTTRPRLTITGPCLIARDTDDYTVSTGFTGAGVLARATTAREAVTAAVRHLPDGLGPVTSGAFVGDGGRG